MEEATRPKRVIRRPPRKRIVREKKNVPQHVRDMLATPEMTAKRMAGLRRWREENGIHWGRVTGQPDGMRKKDFLKLKELAVVKAEKAIRIMADKKIWEADNDVSEKAMRAAIEIMESHSGETRTRLAAAKTILDFVQSKPVVKQETTLKTAEEFLSALAKEDEDDAQS